MTADQLRDIPPHIRQRLAVALESGNLGDHPSLTSLRFALGSDDFLPPILACVNSLADYGVTGTAAGAWLRLADEILTSGSKPDLVWSGPGVEGLNARDTRRVFEELLGSAKTSVWACSYAFFDGPRAFEILARRLDEQPGLKVKLLLNIQRKKGDISASDSVVRRFADQFWSEDWPGIQRPSVYYDPRSLTMEGPTGILHAKAIVVDQEQTFITSANLTEAALDRNIELGVLVRDAAFAQTVSAYFQGLIDRGLLHLIPQE